jgi:glutathione synthase/RimK-type ligase-like ATP-grasp enzyme
MEIAIHNISGSFSERWIEYCKKKKIPFKVVNCYKSNIISELTNCDVIMWNHHHGNYKDVLFAKQLLFTLEQAGKRVFPDFNTSWHFDDKVGQKYLLESIGAPIVRSHVFYNKKEALDWTVCTTFPKVFKLRGGAGSANVRLVENKKEAVTLIKKAFGKGFSPFDRWGNLKERIRKVKSGKDTYVGVLKGIGRLFIATEYAKMHGHEKGYVYFQDFIPNNYYDIRVVVIGNKAFAIKRMVRCGDFRASGSGLINYSKEEIDIRCLNTAFEISRKLNFQCMAYDFIFDEGNNPLVVELSYGFTPAGYIDCPGYWDNDFNWYEGKFNPYGWMVDDIISLKGN